MAIYTTPIARVGDDNFRVGAGYKLHFYAAGTSTDKDTYTSNTYATASSNPVVADGNGRFAVIWTSGDYKVVLKTDADVTVWTVDNYTTDSGSATYAEGVLSASGSAANVITADLPTAPSSLTDQQQVVVELQHGANTIGNPTFNLNSLGAKVIKRDNNKPLRGGDTGGSGNKLYLSYSAANDVWELLNPCMPVLGLGLEWKKGLAVTNNSGTPDEIMDIAVGQILDSTEVAILDLKSAFTKTIASTFAVGTGLGGRSNNGSSAALAANTWYGLFLIGKADGTTDLIYATSQANALADTVVAAASFIYARLVDIVRTDGDSDIFPMVDDGDHWKKWKSNMVDATISVSTSEATTTVLVPPFMRGEFQYFIVATAAATSTAGYGFLYNTSQTDLAASATNNTLYTSSSNGDATSGAGGSTIQHIRVDGSSQVHHQESSQVANAELFTIGWKMDYNVTDLV